MKKFLSILLALVMVLSLVACGGKKTEEKPAEKPADTKTEAPAEKPAEPAKLDWPTQTINIYQTHGAGGDTDYMSRQLAAQLEKVLGVSVVVTNVAGSNGATCTAQYKDGNTDGYTFVCGNTAALSGNKATGMADHGYEAFETVAIYGLQSGENIIVPADAPYNTLGELLDASKAAPGTIRFGISTGGATYISACVLTNVGGAQFNIIDCGDGAARMTALLGGECDASIVPYSTAKEYIEAGQVKSLCTLLKETPTLLKPTGLRTANMDLPEMEINTEYMCLAPKGTPAEIVEAMNAAIIEACSTDEWKEVCNSFCFQDPFVLNVADSLENIKAQDELFQSFVPFL